MHVDVSLPLWCFLDLVVGQRWRVLGVASPPPPPTPPPPPPPAIYAPPPGSTVLVVNLPPPSAWSTQQNAQNRNQTLSSTYSTYIEPVGASGTTTTSTTSSIAPGMATTVSQSAADCTICYEHSVDAVLYTCGHMCLCYSCALQQWRGKGGGHCPLCRAPIRDVIRTYKS